MMFKLYIGVQMLESEIFEEALCYVIASTVQKKKLLQANTSSPHMDVHRLELKIICFCCLQVKTLFHNIRNIGLTVVFASVF